MKANRIRRCRVAPAFLPWDLTDIRRLRETMRYDGVTRVTFARHIPADELPDTLAELREWARAEVSRV